MMIKNASVGERFFGLHFSPGVAEYSDGGDPYRILINESTIKNMDETFVGRPVYVEHVEAPGEIQEADGVVVKSFFNEKDGKHWVEFIVMSDAGKKAIQKGWRLSNAYIPKSFGPGGLWHGVEYQKEVMTGEYEHLAIVPNPRYDESVILTPEQFKKYNSEKEIELKRLANSKGEKSVFNLFKKTKVENSAELESTLVTLPKSKIDKSIAECISLADTLQNMNGYANGDHMVKAGEEEMSVNELAAKYCEMKNTMAEMEKAKNDKEEQPDQKKSEKEEAKDKKEEEAIDKKSNDEMDMDQDIENKKKNEEKEMEEKKKNDAFMNDLYGAPLKPIKNEEQKIVLDKTARGKARYGSN